MQRFRKFHSDEWKNVQICMTCCLLFSYLSNGPSPGSILTNCQDVLKGVTFSVEPRMKVAVVGILLAKSDE